jgi:hypothetical protein
MEVDNVNFSSRFGARVKSAMTTAANGSPVVMAESIVV